MTQTTVDTAARSAASTAATGSATRADATRDATTPLPGEESASAAAKTGAVAGSKSKTRWGVIAACVVGAVAVFTLGKRALSWIRNKLAGGAAGGLAGMMGKGAAVVTYADAKSVKQGAETFAAFVAKPEVTQLVRGLGPDVAHQLLWVFSGVAPQVYVATQGFGPQGARAGVDAAKLSQLAPLLAAEGLVVKNDGTNGISIINVGAAQKVANANPEVFPDLAKSDMRAWLATPEAMLHVSAEHPNAHQAHLWYGLLSGFAPEATQIHCARERLMAKIKGSGASLEQTTAVSLLNEIHMLEHAPKPLSPDKAKRLAEATAELQKHVGSGLSEMERQMIQLVSQELPQPSPIAFNAYTSGDMAWASGISKLAKVAREHPQVAPLFAAAA